jgi:hypothetical protein
VIVVRRMDKRKKIEKYERSVGMTVQETKFIFNAAVVSNEWGRLPTRFENACVPHQKRYLENARKIVDNWASSGTKEYAFDALSSSETGILLIQRFNLWCKGRPRELPNQSAAQAARADAVLEADESDSDWEDLPTEDIIVDEADWEDVPTEDEMPAATTSELVQDSAMVDEATSSGRDSEGTSGNINADALPNNPAPDQPSTPILNDDAFVEDDSKFKPSFEVDEDTLWKNLTFLQVSCLLFIAIAICCYSFIVCYLLLSCDYDD